MFSLTFTNLGALTSKPYAFKARPWELRTINYIDFLDAQGCHIRVDLRDEKILRILPHTSNIINEEWITDRIRFAHDGLKNQRIRVPFVRLHNKSITKNIPQITQTINRLNFTKNGTYVDSYLGQSNDILTSIAVKDFRNNVGANPPVSLLTNSASNNDFRMRYLSNTAYSNIELTDLCLLIGVNLRLEAPILNIKLRRAIANNETLQIFVIGPSINLAYDYIHLGYDTKTLSQFIRGKHVLLNTAFTKSKYPIIFTGEIFNTTPYANVCDYRRIKLPRVTNNIITSTWNGLNHLSLTTSQINTMDINSCHKSLKYTKHPVNRVSCKWLFAFDEINKNFTKNVNDILIFCGFHGDHSASYLADIIIPIAGPFEKDSVFASSDGRYNRLHKIFNFNTIKLFDNINQVFQEHNKTFNLFPKSTKSALLLSRNRRLNFIVDSWIFNLVKFLLFLMQLIRSTRAKIISRVYTFIPSISKKHIPLDNFVPTEYHFTEFLIPAILSQSTLHTTSTVKLSKSVVAYSQMIDNFYSQDSISRASPTRTIAQARLYRDRNFY